MPVDLTTSVTPSTFCSNATKDYVLAGAGKFTATVVLTKTNTGKLSIVTDNDNIGSTIINQGTVQIGTNSTPARFPATSPSTPTANWNTPAPDDTTFNTAFSGTGAFLHTGSGGLDARCR